MFCLHLLLQLYLYLYYFDAVVWNSACKMSHLDNSEECIWLRKYAAETVISRSIYLHDCYKLGVQLMTIRGLM